MTAFIATALVFTKRPVGIIIAILLALNIAQAFNTYANLRFEGPLGIALGFEGWKPRAERFEDALDKVAEAQVEARRAQQAVIDREQARYDALAERIDANAAQTRATVADATNRFIERNRVQDRVCSPSGTSAAASGDGAGEPEAVPASGFVAISDIDVQRCADATRYAVTAHEWIMGLAGE